MSIKVGGRDYRTIRDNLYVNGHKVFGAYVDGVKVYPEDEYSMTVQYVPMGFTHEHPSWIHHMYVSTAYQYRIGQRTYADAVAQFEHDGVVVNGSNFTTEDDAQGTFNFFWLENEYDLDYGGALTMTVRSDKPFASIDAMPFKWKKYQYASSEAMPVWPWYDNKYEANHNSGGIWVDNIFVKARTEVPELKNQPFYAYDYNSTDGTQVFGYYMKSMLRFIPFVNVDATLDIVVRGDAYCDTSFIKKYDIYNLSPSDKWVYCYDAYQGTVDKEYTGVKLSAVSHENHLWSFDHDKMLSIGSYLDTFEFTDGNTYAPLTNIVVRSPNMVNLGDYGSMVCPFEVATLDMCRRENLLYDGELDAFDTDDERYMDRIADEYARKLGD